jgi:hypothetical protein
VTLEELVLLASAAVGALETGDEQDSHAYRDQHGKHATIRRDPMRQVLHPILLAFLKPME